jgi:hypothetical protein
LTRYITILMNLKVKCFLYIEPEGVCQLNYVLHIVLTYTLRAHVKVSKNRKLYLIIKKINVSKNTMHKLQKNIIILTLLTCALIIYILNMLGQILTYLILL